MPLGLAMHADLVVGVCFLIAFAILVHCWRWAGREQAAHQAALDAELCIGRPLFMEWEADELEAIWRRSA